MKRVARALGVFALALVALVALVVGSAFTLLRTNWGGDLVRRLAVPWVDAAIAGSLQLGRFRFGGDHLSLQDVVLRDPEGEVVVRVRELEVAFAPLALLRGQVRIPSLRITEPSLFLRQGPAGFNLSRALAPRKAAATPAKPAEGPAAPSTLTVDVASLRINDGTIDFQSTTDGGTPRVARLSALTLGGNVHYDAGPAAFATSLQVGASVRAPLQAPLDLELTGHGLGERRELALRVTVGDSALAVQAKTDTALDGTLNVSRLRVAPDLVRALAPGVSLLVPIVATAEVVRKAGTLAVDTRVKTSAGGLTARGTVDVPAGAVRPFAVSASDVDLGRIVAGWPRSNLSLTAEGQATGRRLDELSGTVTLAMPAGRVAGAPIGPVALRVKAVAGQFGVEELRAVLPGLTLAGHGAAGPARLALDIAIDATELGLTSRTLASFPGLATPKFTGRGRLDLSLSGTTLAPAARIRARFPRLTVGDNRVVGLKLDATIPDAHLPMTADAELHLTEARVAGRTVQDSTLRVRSQSRSRRLDVEVELGGATPLSLVAGGTLGRDLQSFALDQFRLRYPEATWTLAGPAGVSWRPEHLAVSGLELRAGPQRLRLNVNERAGRVRAKIAVEQFDLGRLPKVALPESLTVGGRLDLNADLEAALKGGAAPTARATVNLVDGRFGKYRDLALDLDGQYRGGRVAGRVTARGFGTGVEARFDLPTEGPLADARGPLLLDLTTAETDLTTVLTAAGVALRRRVAGRVGIAVHLQGTARSPALQLDTTARGLVVDDQAVGDLALTVSGDDAHPLVATLALAGAASRPPGDTRGQPVFRAGALTVKTDLALAALARGMPTTAALMRTHFDVSGTLDGMPLATLATLAQSTALSGGTASLRVSASGTVRAPTGALNLTLAGATGPRLPATDARLDAAFGEHDTRLALRVLRRGRELLSASGVLGLASRRLADLGALAAAPLTVTAAVGPLRLSRDSLPGAADPTANQVLSTTAQATLSLAGTLGNPRLSVLGDFSDGRLGTTPIGSGQVRLTYENRLAQADVQVHSPASGELRLTSRVPIDLGYPRVAEGFDPERLSFEARLTAERFDLALLSGVTKDVRVVGGQVSATVTAQGAVGAPRVRGQVEWTNGALSLTGLGDYARIHLKAHGDESAVWLEELSLLSGDGNARLSAHASRRADRGYALEAHAALRRFPIYGQGQVLARVSVDGSATGQASPAELRATARISEAHVELTDAKQKNLQPLGRPGDVIMVDRARPLDRAEAAKLEALAVELGGGRPARDATKREARHATPASPFQAHLTIDAPRNLWVQGKDASIELGLGPDFRVDASGPPRIYGHVVIRRGRIDVLGRRFDLQPDSVIRFIGPPDDPRLDVTARYFNETENIAVILTARGTLQKLAIAVSSPDRPDLTEGQLYTLIVTGRLQLGGNTAGSTGFSDEAASLVGGLVAAQLQKTLAKRLPLDVLTLQAGQGLTGSRLEAGTYLTPKLYAGYVGRVGANPALLQNRNAVHVEYQLSRRWSFDGEYGDVGTGTADLLWTKHY